DGDRLENYVLEHRIRGSVWGREEPWMWRRPQGKTDEDLPVLDPQPAEMDALRRRLRDPVTRLASALAAPLSTVRQIITAVYDLFEGFAVRQTLSEWITAARARNHHEQAG